MVFLLSSAKAVLPKVCINMHFNNHAYYQGTFVAAELYHIGANGPRFAGTVPFFGALSPLTYKNFYCGPRFHRLWEYWCVFKYLLVLLIFDSTQNQLS